MRAQIKSFLTLLVPESVSSTDEFRKSIPWVAERCQTAMTELEDLDQTLNQQHAKQEQAYREIMEKSHEEKGRSTERTKITKTPS